MNTRLRVVVTHYKTSSKYGIVDALLSPELSSLIKEYIEKKKLKEGDYLFGKKELSNYVSSKNKIIGETGSGAINLFRKMKLTDEYESKNLTKDERVELADKLKHSPIVQLTYLRKHRKS
jgi:hypothetical protein